MNERIAATKPASYAQQALERRVADEEKRAAHEREEAKNASDEIDRKLEDLKNGVTAATTSTLAWAKILQLARGNPSGWRKSVEAIFRKFDRNGNGGIDVGELGMALKKLGAMLTPKQLVLEHW